MKKILLIVMIGILTLGITGCQKKTLSMKTTDKSTLITSNDKGVTIETSDKTLSANSVTLIIKNNSDKEIGYDDAFEIEMEKEDGWYKLENNMNFNSESYSLQPGEEKELKLDWKEGYGSLLSGTYRIVKKVTPKVEDKDESFYIGVTFGIIASY